jgi:hypothetical protein
MMPTFIVGNFEACERGVVGGVSVCGDGDAGGDDGGGDCGGRVALAGALPHRDAT